MLVYCKKCSNLLDNVTHMDLTKIDICICEKCGYRNKILDISYKNDISAPLSNLFPHKFEIDGIVCQSMESFIQSLRVKDKNIQRQICEKYSGYMAYKMRLSLSDWRIDGFVYWQGEKIDRNSKKYTDLISRAYDCLFENDVFRYCLNKYKDHKLIHSIGNIFKSESLLTEFEYIEQLERLIEKL